MGKSIQDYSWIQDFEADLKMLNSAGNNSFSDLVSVYLKVFGHLTWNFWYFEGIQNVLNSDFLKFRIFFNFELSPMHISLYSVHIWK